MPELNWIGLASRKIGLGIHSLQIAEALCREGYTVNYIPIGDFASDPTHLMGLLRWAETPDRRLPTVRVCGFEGPGHPFGSIKIAYIVLETTPIPQATIRSLTRCDGIWVPSKWLAATLTEAGARQSVSIVPAGVDPLIFHPNVAPKGPRKRRAFRFLSIGKWEERKELDLLLKAFAEAFSPSEDVELLIHTHFDHLPGWYDIRLALTSLNLPSHAPIVISSRTLERNEVAGLFRTADAFDFTSRAEGFGLPVLEAMACGVPVITPIHTGLAEFCCVENCLEVQTEGNVPAYDPLIPNYWPSGSFWFEPSIESIRQQLRKAVEAPELLKKISTMGLQTSIEWSWRHAANKATKVLQDTRYRGPKT